jgi:hypothetical protein
VLQRFVDELEPERWSVFVLSEIEGLRGSEIAAELGLNLNTVYARLRSARQAFERTLRRYRARERRGLASLLVWPPRFIWAGGVALSGGIALSAVVMSCDHEDGSSRNAEPSASAPTVATRSREPASERVLASDTASVASAPGWIESGSSVSMGHNTKGEGYTLSSESRYRLDGDRVVLEVTYIGDDEVTVDAVGHQLALDGFELVDGATEWALEIPASETRVVSTVLRATREGVVRLRMASSNGSRRFAWVLEHGQLRPCNERECEPPIGEEQLSGERITVHVHNKCSVSKEFVLFAGYPDVRPPETVTVHSLEPGERRSMEIDAAQWFLHRHADGHIGGGGQTDTDDARVTFYEMDDTCSGMSTTTN